MTEIPDIASWPESTAADLRKVADEVAASAAPECLGEKRLSFGSLAEHAGDAIDQLTTSGIIDRDRCVYVLTLDDGANVDDVKAAFVNAKSLPDIKLPQDNGAVSNTLYVGSSCATKKRKGTLRSRLRHHLIKAPKGTYALSLAQWTSHLKGGLILRAWQFPSAGEGNEGDLAARRVVLAVEDWLSNELKPILGRRGSRN